MQINAGVFNKKIQIIKYLITKDVDGFEIKTEELIFETYAQVSNTSGTEIQKSNSDFSQVKTRFFIRTPNTTITIENNYKIKFNNNIYEIVYVNDYSFDKKYTEIMCILVVK